MASNGIATLNLTKMTNFTAIFVGSLAANILVTFRSSDLYRQWRSPADAAALEDSSKEEWMQLLRRYLCVYLLATLSDWLQGPYVYALYADYGYSQHDIAVLFVAGFGSSMVFGSFIGGMADQGGRRRFALLFCAVYAASCVTKHFRDYNILMLGRLLGGVATSLLFSVFDAWLIRAHADAKVKHWLSKSFSWAAYGNSVIAIVAGLMANKAAHAVPMRAITKSFFYVGGYLNPFDLAIMALLACSAFIISGWEENYGDTSAKEGQRWYQGLRSALTTTVRNQEILLCGLISAAFEGSMYIFVFMWTPALTAGADVELPFGLIFSTFMVCCMAGSSLFSIFIDSVPGEQLAIGVFGIAALSMLLIATASSQTLQFLAMNLFEVTVGMYFPIMGTMKSAIVPESKRAAIYNLYRIPLNFIVLFSLLTDLEPATSFYLNAGMLSLAVVMQFVLMMKRREVNTALESQESSGLLVTAGSKDSSV